MSRVVKALGHDDVARAMHSYLRRAALVAITP
jgi:hypothetical protein